MVALIDNGGLICGFRLTGGTVDTVTWQTMDGALAADDAVIWLHLNLTDQRTRQWIAHSRILPPRAIEILLDADNHMRLESLGSSMIGVLGDLHHAFDADHSDVGVVRLYFDERRLITARREPLRATDLLRKALRSGGLQPTRAVDLVAELLNQLANAIDGVIGELNEAVDRVEDHILAGRTESEPADLGRVRRTAARLRRHLVPQRQALAGVLGRLPAWLGGEAGTELRQAAERLTAVGHDLDLVQERAQLLQGELSNRLQAITNRNLFALSVVTTIFLPMTLITGVFGMNVASLPGLETPGSFWWVVGGMVAVAAISLVLLHWRRLF